MRRFTTLLAVASLTALLAAPVAADWNAGVAAFQNGDYATAAREFQALVETSPNQWQGHLMLGKVLLKLGRNQEALESLRKAYDLAPNNVDIQLTLATAYTVNDRYRDAAALLKTIEPSALPSSQRSYYNQLLATAMSRSGDASGALAPLREAANADPSSAKAQYDYGVAAYNLGDTDTAVSALGKAVALSGATNEMRRAYVQALFRRGRTASGSTKTRAYAQAVAPARSLAQSSPTADHYMLLGEALLGAGSYGDAVTAFRQASSRTSDSLPFYYMGQAYMQQGQYGSAASVLQQGLERASDSRSQTRIWRLLGLVYEKGRNFEQARQAYLRAGDNASAQRVQENQEIAEYNEQVEAENERIREIEAERRRIEEELKDLPGGQSGDDD